MNLRPHLPRKPRLVRFRKALLDWRYVTALAVLMLCLSSVGAQARGLTSDHNQTAYRAVLKEQVAHDDQQVKVLRDQRDRANDRADRADLLATSVVNASQADRCIVSDRLLRFSSAVAALIASTPLTDEQRALILPYVTPPLAVAGCPGVLP